VIYLDHNGSTPVDPRVLEVMLPLYTELYADPAGGHPWGDRVVDLMDVAAVQVRELVGAPEHGLIWTSGAGEAANLGLRGVLTGPVLTPGRSRVLVGAGEHPAVLESARRATATGRGLLGTVGTRPDGRIDLDHLDALLDADIALVAVTAANGETGALNDIAEVSRRTRRSGALVFCDVAQAAGKVPVRLADWGVDLAVLSGHKLYGPKGIGALIGNRDLLARLDPLLVGGGQQGGRRAGTLDPAAIVGFGRAAELAGYLLPRTRRQARLTRLLEKRLVQRLPGVSVNGPGPTGRLPNTVNLRFAGAPADAVLTALPDVVISAGAACRATAEDPSPVLLAMGVDRAAAGESLRFSLGRGTTEAEVRAATDRVAYAVERVRSLRGALARWGEPARRRPPGGR
jgi:cysteine desulfurase